ncbi:hypothetical protein [Streptomyces sp900116325]|uniref:hypothetical protein n=1 Tax=unclassified Streptomyces TaxID=2593676 RepID=UPI0033F1EE43
MCHRSHRRSLGQQDQRALKPQLGAPLGAPDITTPGGRLVFHVFAPLAEFIREPIVIGTKEASPTPATGSAEAPASPPRRSSAPPATCCPTPGRSITSIAKLLGVSRGALYSHVPDPRELRAGAIPRQLEAPTR